MSGRHAAAAGLLAAASLALAACGGSGTHETPAVTTAAPRAAAELSLGSATARARHELDGITQQGLLLGSPSAPVQIIEYASLACSACARVHRAVVPELIARYVRSGVASLEFRGVADGPRARSLALGAYAASRQHRGWEFVQLAYLRSLAPSGRVDSPEALAAALALDPGRFRQDLRGPEGPLLLKAAASVVRFAGFASPPLFLVRGRGRSFTPLAQPTAVGQFAKAIAAAERKHG